MPLGPQFSNTYWEDPTSKSVKSSTELPTPEGSLPTAAQRTPQIAEGFGTSATPQGMLFSPHAYTGLKDDPTVPAVQRMSVINKSMRLPGLDALTQQRDKNLQSNKDAEEFNRTRDPATTKRRFARYVVDNNVAVTAQKNEALGKAANNLDIPTNTYEKDFDTYATPTAWNTGSARGSYIEVGVRPVSGKTTVKETQAYPASDKPIPNTKFWSQYEKQYDHPGDVHSIMWEKNIHWTNPEGHNISGSELKEHPAYTSEEAAMDWLKDNKYHPNVYPTKGKSTPKYSVGKKVSIETGYSDRSSGDYTYSPWHTRYEPDNTKEPKTVSIQKKSKGGYEANQGTLAHELGHTQEPSSDSPERDLTRRRGKDLINTDAVSEGYADALMDRAHTYAGQFEKHLTNTQQRAEDISTTGYSSKYHMWNAEERALYAAVRFHVAAHPERIGEMQNRKDMEDSMLNWRSSSGGAPEPTTRLMLGHMYEHMPHVRPVLHELGFGKTSKTAHEFYNSRVPDLRYSGRGKKREVHEQPNLPGM
jgi:hypothetical protein